MKSNNKRIAKNSLFLYARMLLILGVSLYTSRVVLAALGVTDFGIFNAVAGVVSMLAFINSSLTNACQRFITFELGKNNVERANQYFNQSLLLFSFLCIILLLLFETVGLWLVNNKMVIPDNRLFAANIVYQFSIVICLLSVINVPFQSCIVAEEKMDVYAYVGIFDVFIKLAIVVILQYVSTDRLILYGFLYFCVQIIVVFFYLVYCVRNFHECKFKFFWNKELVKSFFSFISFNALGGLSWSIAYQGATIILNIFFGPVVNAARGIAMQINGSLGNFTSGIITAVQPQIIKSYAARDLEYMEQLIVFSSKYSLLLFIFLSFPVMTNIDFILSVWLKEVPSYTNIFAILIIIDTMFSTLVIPITISINATGDIKNMQIYGRFITLSALPISYLIYKFNIYNTPSAIFIVLIFAQILYWLFGIREMHQKIGISYLNYFKKVFLGILLTILLCAIINNFIVIDYDGWHGFILRTVINVFSVLFVGFIIAVSKEERKWLYVYIKGFFKKQ